MTRIQLRPFWSPEELSQVYSTPYDHTKWVDHRQRVARTIALGNQLCAEAYAQSASDLSAGDGAILRGL